MKEELKEGFEQAIQQQKELYSITEKALLSEMIDQDDAVRIMASTLTIRDRIGNILGN